MRRRLFSAARRLRSSARSRLARGLERRLDRVDFDDGVGRYDRDDFTINGADLQCDEFDKNVSALMKMHGVDQPHPSLEQLHMFRLALEAAYPDYE